MLAAMPRATTIDLAPPIEKVFLVAVDAGDDPGWHAEDSLAELASLAETAGAEVVGAEWQNRRHVDPNWYVGKGKAEELLAAKAETGFSVLVADDELSPGQQRALEELLKVKVIDRSRLILDIFAQHARTHEGRLQVELAQLEYQLPRLTRMWTHLSRTGGGIGTRGPGETQLETDRRIIRERIKKMKERVEDVRQQRETAARGRDRRLVPTVSIVGYTNAGKSTLLNALVGSEVTLAEDKLFATLDPTSRQVKLGDGQTAIITDTVGFIHKLPHQLVDAFRATLEEVTRADVLIEIVDASDGHFAEHRATVQTVLDELGAGEKPRLVAFNKADLLGGDRRAGRCPDRRGERPHLGAHRLRPRRPPGRAGRGPRVAGGRRRCRGPLCRRRAPRARPGAGGHRAGVPGSRRPRPRPGRACPGRRAERRRRTLGGDAPGGHRAVTCRPEALDLRLPGPFRPLAVPRRVVVVKRKHGERRDRWQWDGDLVGTAGRGWRVVRHVRGRDERRLLAASDAEQPATRDPALARHPRPGHDRGEAGRGRRLLEVKVDAALPVPFAAGRLVFVDLDVDVVRDAAGVVTVRDWDTFESRVELLGYTDASRAVARAGETFGLALLAAWEPTLDADVAAILAAAADRAMVDKDCYHRYQR